MTATFKRFWNVGASFQAGTVLIDNSDGLGVRFQWDITRTIEQEPDQGEVRIANLSEATRKQLERESRVDGPFKGTLKQGWDGVTQLLMFADVYDITPDDYRDPTTTWTIMRLGDGLEGTRDGAITQSLGDVDVNTIVNLTSAAMNIAVGEDAKSEIAKALPSAKINRWNDGFTAIDSARDVLTEVLGMLKLRWTIQNGRLVVVPRGKAIPGPALLLTPSTGLLNSAVQRDGSLKLEAYSNPGAVPGRQVQLRDEHGKPIGEIAYRVQEARFFGDTDAEALMALTCRRSQI